MKNLKEISQQSPSTYRVIDMAVRNGYVKEWSDTIEIVIERKSKFVKRRAAYKYGLAEKV